MDKGLQLGMDVIIDETRDSASAGALIMLTDGQQTHEPEKVITVSKSAREKDIQVYVIGLGEGVDQTYLTRVAGSDNHYFFAASPQVLEPLYSALAQQIPCPPASNWGRR